MEPMTFQDKERFRVKLLEMRKKIDKIIWDLVDDLDNDLIQSIKGRMPANHVTPTPIRITSEDTPPPDGLG